MQLVGDVICVYRSYSSIFIHNITSIYSQQYTVLATCFGCTKPSSGQYLSYYESVTCSQNYVLLTIYWYFFFIFCWPCISIYLFININQLEAQNLLISLFQASTCFEHMCLSSGGQTFYYTASGIITPIGGRPVHGTATYRCDDTRDCIVQFLPPWRWAHVLETCRGMK